MAKPERSVHLAQLVYECDGCGACCRHSIIEADHNDALREPRIQQEAQLLDGHGKVPLEDAPWGLNNRAPNRKDFACVFLCSDNKCGIYATRPGLCVTFQAGSGQCQQRRATAGLKPLAPKKVKTRTMAVKLHQLHRDFDE